jgi:YD repeat-containing protein
LSKDIGPMGNRLSQTSSVAGLSTTTNRVCDDANRLTSVNGVNYTWDNNGNLLNDGVNAYSYDSANRLQAVSNQQSAINYAYNGLNDRLQETVNGITTTFTMDLNTGLAEALSDGINTYVYGVGRIAQVNTGTEYFLGDALGSVRQLTNASGSITYARVYDP